MSLRLGYYTTFTGFGHYLELITMQTRADNATVKNICAKLGIGYETEHFSGNGHDIDLLTYQVSRNVYDKIADRLLSRGEFAGADGDAHSA